MNVFLMYTYLFVYIDLYVSIVCFIFVSLFSHYHLCQCTFNTNYFQPRKNIVTEYLHIETVVPDGLEVK
jgi:hypothetical protein